MPEPWTPSRRLQTAARAERDRIERELVKLDTEHKRALARLRKVEAAQTDLREQLAMLDRIGHLEVNAIAVAAIPADADDTAASAPEVLPTPPANAAFLRGVRIREAAVRVLVKSPHRHAPIHYRQWYELFISQGFVPAGNNPLATFLVQLGRSPVVRRTTQSGVYELDLEFPKRTHHRLTQLREQLAHLHASEAESRLSSLVETRERRATLTAEIERLERSLEEALRSLGEEADTPPLPAQAV